MPESGARHPGAPFSLLAAAGILLAAANLRPALTSVSALLTLIGVQLDLSAAALGALTTLPVLCLGLSAPLAPLLVRRIGQERSVVWLLALLVVVLLLRPYTGVAGFFVGTALAGCAMGALGVLLPALVKRDFPSSVSLMTGLYTMVLSLGAAAAAGATEPLRLALGQSWQAALAFWLLPAGGAVLAWWPRSRRAAQPPTRHGRAATSLLRDPLAWQVTFFMGLQSALAYIMLGWLPAILADRGLSAVAAGAALSAAIVVSMASAVAAPWASTRMRDQRVMNVVSVVLFLTGLVGCIHAPLATLWLWVSVMGLGMGAAFAMALTLIALRASDIESSGRMSAMAQGFGYVLAALGPLTVGLLRDATGGWGATGILLAVIGVSAIGSGLAAGRNRMLVVR